MRRRTIQTGESKRLESLILDIKRRQNSVEGLSDDRIVSEVGDVVKEDFQSHRCEINARVSPDVNSVAGYLSEIRASAFVIKGTGLYTDYEVSAFRSVKPDGIVTYQSVIHSDKILSNGQSQYEENKSTILELGVSGSYRLYNLLASLLSKSILVNPSERREK